MPQHSNYLRSITSPRQQRGFVRECRGVPFAQGRINSILISPDCNPLRLFEKLFVVFSDRPGSFCNAIERVFAGDNGG